MQKRKKENLIINDFGSNTAAYRDFLKAAMESTSPM